MLPPPPPPHRRVRFKEKYQLPQGPFRARIVTISGLMTFARAAKKVKMHRDVIAAFSLSFSLCLSVSHDEILPRRGKSSSLRRQIGVEKHRERRFVWGTIEGQCISGRCAVVQSNIQIYTHVHTYNQVAGYDVYAIRCSRLPRAREKGFLHSRRYSCRRLLYPGGFLIAYALQR